VGGRQLNNLSNEIMHLSKVLEKQIPKGYHEIVTEYVRKSMVSGTYKVLEAIACIFLLYFIIKFLLRSIHNKDGFYYEDYEVSLPGVALFAGTVFLGIILVVLFFTDLEGVATNFQHAVAPNYYLIKSFIK